jgi:hypothetical protein
MMNLNQPPLGIGARIKHPAFGVGIVVGMDVSTLDVFFSGEGDKQISRSFQGLEVLEGAREADNALDMATVEKALARVLQRVAGIHAPVEMAPKWKKGNLVLTPGNPELQGKELPIETFFHKIVMVRDRLRVLEQHINSHEKLEEQDKIQLQQYISRCYGSLTTFNVLFAYKDDYFSSK